MKTDNSGTINMASRKPVYLKSVQFLKQPSLGKASSSTIKGAHAVNTKSVKATGLWDKIRKTFGVRGSYSHKNSGDSNKTKPGVKTGDATVAEASTSITPKSKIHTKITNATDGKPMKSKISIKPKPVATQVTATANLFMKNLKQTRMKSATMVRKMSSKPTGKSTSSKSRIAKAGTSKPSNKAMKFNSYNKASTDFKSECDTAKSTATKLKDSKKPKILSTTGTSTVADAMKKTLNGSNFATKMKVAGKTSNVIHKANLLIKKLTNEMLHPTESKHEDLIDMLLHEVFQAIEEAEHGILHKDIDKGHAKQKFADLTRPIVARMLKDIHKKG